LTLVAAADALAQAAADYWRLAHQAGVHGAVKWIEYSDGRLVIVTRGEYAEQLLANVCACTPTLAFGSWIETEESPDGATLRP
jgi:hypothetical protein